MLGGGGFCFPLRGGAAGGAGAGAGVWEDPCRVMGGWWRGEGVGKKA